MAAAKKSPKSAERRLPSAPVPVPVSPPSWHVRQEAFRSSWEASLAPMEVVERFTVGEVAVGVHAPRGPRVHWLLFTTGLWPRGVELCLRVPRRAEELTPPQWAMTAFRTLVELAAAAEGPPLTTAQVLTLGEPLAPGSEMTTFAFALEPSLGAVATPYDTVQPLLAVGLIRDEERIVREWSPSALLEVLAQADPLLATDLERSSLLLSPRARLHIEQRVEREGSSLSAMWAVRSSVSSKAGAVVWSLSVEAVDTLVSLLKGRIGHHRPFGVHAVGGAVMEIVPADRPTLQLKGAIGRLELSQPAARQLRAILRAKEGRYAIESLPELTIEVV